MSKGIWDDMERGIEKGNIRCCEGNWPSLEFSSEDVGRDFAKFIAWVMFASTIFAAAGASETAKDDGIADAAGLREWFGKGCDGRQRLPFLMWN